MIRSVTKTAGLLLLALTTLHSPPLKAAQGPLARNSPKTVPPDPNHPDPFFNTIDLSEFLVVDGLDYPVPAGIDRKPGFPPTASADALETYTAVDPNE